MTRNPSAFTLIELLVVVLIIGILASIALPQYQKAVIRSRYQQAIVLVDAIQKAQTVYFMTHGTYTNDFEELDIDLPAPQSTSDGNGFNILRYSWGNCPMNNRYIQCQMSSGPTLSLIFSSMQRRCIANVGTLNEKICQLETSKTTPDLIGEDGGARYIYP